MGGRGLLGEAQGSSESVGMPEPALNAFAALDD